MTKIAVVGATGPTGMHLVTELRKTVASVRVIARSMDKLAQLFPEVAVEKWGADIRDANATLLAVEGCDVVYDCIGLPGDQMHLHPVIARNIASALRHTKARCVQVSSYWAYYPQVRTEMNESHSRSGGHGYVTGVRPRMFYARRAPPFCICPTSTGPMCTSVRCKTRSTRRRPAKRSTGSEGRIFNANTFMSPMQRASRSRSVPVMTPLASIGVCPVAAH